MCRSIAVLVEDVFHRRELAVDVERHSRVGEGHVQDTAGADDPEHLAQPCDGILEMLDKMVGDHEVDRQVLERGKVLRITDDRHWDELRVGQLLVLLVQLLGGNTIDVADLDPGGDEQRRVESADLDAGAAQPAGSPPALGGVHAHDSAVPRRRRADSRR